MQSIRSLSCMIFLLTVLDCIECHTRDCYYNESQNHVEYVCDGDVGMRFNQKTNEMLYCHNYYSGINRTNVESVSFRNCLIFGMAIFNLWNFIGLRVLNISFFGFELLPDFLFKHNIHLERVLLSHNHLNDLPATLFNNTPELTDVDFSFNRITELNPPLFDNTRKLKIANFSFNALNVLNTTTFSHLNQLEILDLSNNNIKIIHSELLAYNKQLKILNLNNNNVKQLSCEFLAIFTRNYLLNIFINTLEEIQTNCFRGEKRIDFDIVISSKESITRLHIFQGDFKWMFCEADFIKIHYMNFLSNRIRNTIDIFQDAYTNETKYFEAAHLYVIEYFLGIFIIIVILILIVRVCKHSMKLYIKSIVVFSVERDLANHNLGTDNKLFNL